MRYPQENEKLLNTTQENEELKLQIIQNSNVLKKLWNWTKDNVIKKNITELTNSLTKTLSASEVNILEQNQHKLLAPPQNFEITNGLIGLANYQKRHIAVKELLEFEHQKMIQLEKDFQNITCPTLKNTTILLINETHLEIKKLETENMEIANYLREYHLKNNYDLDTEKV